MYPENTIAVGSTDNDRALADIIAVEEDAEAFEDADPLPSTDGTDDSDLHDAPNEKEMDDVLGDEEGSSDENDVDGISEENEDEDQSSDEDEEIGESKYGAEPKIHQTLSKNRKVVRFGSLKKTYDSWKALHAAFVVFQRETYQQFSKRTSSEFDSYRLGNYSITFKCIHGQEYKARGKGKRKHRKVRDTKCSAKLNARVTATSYGGWGLKCLRPVYTTIISPKRFGRAMLKIEL
ncbi:hypothetical protein GN244_ATG07293 [Phytophthora infestans]|uniref:Uncharacterized protein n=1 Tax=Phytophthora infestans TaxID=4787 RepID=A0A833SXW2_PHYIN|nr:hypothetical protein GN244_ATG07293 [Phytophthora infestans]